MTFVANTPLTAAQLNTFARDNFNELAPAKATTAASSWFNSTGRNAIAERVIASATVASSQLTTQTNYGNIPGGTVGPSVTVSTGKQVICIISALISPNASDNNGYINVDITGDTTRSPTESTELIGVAPTAAHATTTCFIGWIDGLNEGVNTFTLKYKTSAGSTTFASRRILIMAVW